MTLGPLGFIQQRYREILYRDHQVAVGVHQQFVGARPVVPVRTPSSGIAHEPVSGLWTNEGEKKGTARLVALFGSKVTNGSSDPVRLP